MGVSFNKVSLSGYPLRSIAEQLFIIPTESGQVVVNHGYKLILFFHAHGRVAIDDGEEFDLRDGDLLLLPKPCVQRYRDDSSRSAFSRLHALVVVVDHRVVWKRVARSARSRLAADFEFADFLRKHFSAPRHMRGGEGSRAESIMRELRRECEYQMPHREEKIEALLETLFVEMARSSGLPEAASSHSRLIRETRAFLGANLARALTLPEVARHLRVTREYLAREFHRQTGSTVFACLKELRLERAKTLLLSSENSVGDVARQVGFPHLSAFCRTFRQEVGLSALQYRMRFSELPVISAPA